MLDDPDDFKPNCPMSKHMVLLTSCSGVCSIVISENSLEDAYNKLTTGGEAWSNEKLKGNYSIFPF